MLTRTLERGWEVGDWSLPTYAFISWSAIPKHAVVAALSSEDRGFFQHRGFDEPAIRRAWKRYREEPDKPLIGGSTISQQVARNVFLTQNRSWIRKGLEAYYTIWLELLVPKKRILEVYVNIAEMGPMVFGIESAAQFWFHKHAYQLKPIESAQLIAMLPSPRQWTPKTPHVQRRAQWMLHAPAHLPL